MNINVTRDKGTWTATAEIDGKKVTATSKKKDAEGRDAALEAIREKLAK